MHSQDNFTSSATSYFCDGSSNHHRTIFLPLVNESSWPNGLRGFLYFLGIFQFLVGIFHGVNVFMGAISVITSATKKVQVKDPLSHQWYTRRYPVWNKTVATLTLGAVGTCLPEILLSTIETIGHGFDAGSLGPGTIIGSAAFNLLVTLGICIFAVPSPERREIEEVPVYVVTTIFRVFAYLWLVVILRGTSSKVIEVWEAALTLSLFFVLVIVAYGVDKYSQRSHLASHENRSNGESKTAAELKLLSTSTTVDSSLTAEFPHPGHEETLAEDTHLYAYFRPSLRHKIRHHNYLSNSTSGETNCQVAKVQFATNVYALAEEDRFVTLKLEKTGDLNQGCSVRCQTLDGTATLKDGDYIYKSEIITFEPLELEKTFVVEVVVQDKPEPDEIFYVKIFPVDKLEESVHIGRNHLAEITIRGSIDTCQIGFKDRRVVVKESEQIARIYLSRVGRVSKRSQVRLTTVDGTAKSRVDYTKVDQYVVFEPGECEKEVDISLINTGKSDKNSIFRAFLSEPNEGVQLGDLHRIVILITGDEGTGRQLAEASELVTKLLEESGSDWRSAWRNQFFTAMNVNGGDFVMAHSYHYVAHSISFHWKVLCAFVPPPDILGGYVTMVLSLLLIGLLTIALDDMTKIFGCVCNLHDVIIGVALVSVGTNLPDLFASRFAAIHDREADDAILHINGAISVNVFLGLGIPWLIASVYWHLQGKEFRVNSEDLFFSLVVYIILSAASTILLIVRRRLKLFGRCELGGPMRSKFVCVVILLLSWILYVVVTYMLSEEIIGHIEH